MKPPDHRNLCLFITYPVIAMFFILFVAVYLIAAWPTTLFADLTKKPDEPAKEQPHD